MMYECGRHELNSSCEPGNLSLSAPPPSTWSASMLSLICELYVITALCLVGLVGNLLAVVVMRHDVLRREALLLLQILAVVDAAYLITALARYPTKHIITSTDVYTRLQLYVYPLLKTCQTATIWLMVLVTVDRYIFVCWPLTAQQWCTGRNRRAMAAFICVVALFYNLPRFFDSCIQQYFDPCTNITISHRIYRFHSRAYFDIYQNAAYLIFLYVAPLSILTIVNIKLVQAIRNSRKFQPRGHRGEREYSDSNATLVLIIIVLVFIVCETPELVMKIITLIDNYSDSLSLFDNKMIYLGIASEVLMVLNSSINFFVYVAFGRRFRHIMKETFMYFTHSNATLTTHETAPLHHLHRHGFPYNNKRFVM